MIEYLFIFFVGICVGFGLAYQVITAVVQHGIDKGKIKLEILDLDKS